jgi:hypothetical protein
MLRTFLNEQPDEELNKSEPLPFVCNYPVAVSFRFLAPGSIQYIFFFFARILHNEKKAYLIPIMLHNSLAPNYSNRPVLIILASNPRRKMMSHPNSIMP